MKTSFKIYELGTQLILTIPVLILGLVSCDPPGPPVTEISSGPSIIDRYVGNFEMAQDNCHTEHYSIEISPVIPDISYDPITPSKIYISNLMNSDRTPLEAEWDGAFFILKNQSFTEGNNALLISGRVYQSESELTINYTLPGNGKSRNCSAVFTRKF